MTKKVYGSFIFSLTFCLVCSTNIIAQTARNPASSQSNVPNRYSNTTDGLRQFLVDCVAAAKANDQSQLDSAVKNMEIPDYAQWFPKTWPEPGKSWAAAYDKGLKENRILMKNLLIYLANQDGEFGVRSVNDNPQGGQDNPQGGQCGLERGLLHGSQPVSVYYASWKQDDALIDVRDLPIGYFLYVDGNFRWDSTIRFPREPIRTVDPIYPYPANGKHPQGVVALRFAVLPDGSVSPRKFDIMEGPRFTTDSKLVQAAITAVKQWRFRPPRLYVISDEMIMIELITVEPQLIQSQTP